MKLTMQRTVLNGASPLQTDRYSEEMIQQFNAEHDRVYGFSQQFKNLYCNVRRLPEFHFGPPETLWSNKQQTNQ